jgi:PKD repeat protein
MKHKGLTIRLMLILVLVLLLALVGTAGAQEPTPPEGCAQLTDPGAADLTDEEVAALKADCPEPEQQAQAAVASASVTLLSAGGPDAFGYIFIDSNESGGPAYNFEDISSTGTVLTLGDDQLSGPIGLGFTFNYYGFDYSQIYVSSNGFLSVQPTSQGCCTGRPLPSIDSVNGVIAGWWEDLDPRFFRPNLYYQTLGSTPNRRFIVQVNAVPHYYGGYGRYRVTFQYKLFEGTNDIEVHYQAAPSDGGVHSAGIEDPSGTIGLQYYLGRSGLATPLAVLYTPVVPTADPGGPYVGVEGSPVAFDGSGSSDPNGDPLQYDWDFGDGSPVAINAGAAPSHTYGDNGTYTACVTVTDPGGYSDTQCTDVTIDNVNPTVGSISAPTAPVLLGTQISADAAFTDPGFLDTHTALWDWGDDTTSAGTVSSGAVGPDSHTYSAAGIYMIQLTVTDDDEGSGQSVFQYVVVYDPSAGFVTGGGWIDSPAGAYTPDTSLTGKANFSFVSKYKKGAETPTGNTEFQFHAASLNFHSDTYEWLVIAGATAKFKGTGTINGSGNYGFMLSAKDEKLTPSTDVDMFRIKIWDKDNGDAIVYDNEMGEDDDADPTTGIAGGSIVIHKKK